MTMTVYGTEIAFFDVETSAPERCALLEFGAILVCPRRLVDVSSYATLVRPDDLDAVFPASWTGRSNGITRDAIAGAPPFRDVADNVYAILHGRVWAGHNILEFDTPIIRKAFAEIGRAPPEPKGVIDTLPLLTRRFGVRAGDMKLASLANYFGLGKQKHRSLDDIRMNIEILKYCSTVLLLEPSSPAEVSDELVCDVAEMQLDAAMQKDASSSGYSGFLEPGDVSIECIKISVALLHQFGRPTTQILHKSTPLQLSCTGLEVRFGVNPKFLDNAGRPKLNIKVVIPENLRKVLEFCDDLAKKSSPEACGTSEWIPLIKMDANAKHQTVRLNIPTVVSGETATYATDICKKERNGAIRKLVFSKVDEEELDSLLRWNKVDAFFSLELYDYKQNAGIRLVAKRLVVHSR
ncbi:hypothetical protein EJB05_22672 [Eragrostis curvula]|uniref:Exonuclease domain-containing protein n=1 Tax=Eragrostis curvula TaxID=38414 RepID=A0A5J9V4H6_9POAL|nr:hypothetical protein EJB05_22671 [Eragrostis curvula]TVU31010.1 hypothetical protein EJB05_22672 [Eragrostis curvula]